MAVWVGLDAEIAVEVDVGVEVSVGVSVEVKPEPHPKTRLTVGVSKLTCCQQQLGHISVGEKVKRPKLGRLKNILSDFE